MKSGGMYAILAIGLVIALAPMLWTLSSSLKPVEEIFDYPPAVLPETWEFNNYVRIFSEFSFVRWFINSVVTSAVATVIGVFLCALGGFGFAKYNFRGKNVLFAILLSSMMIPFVVLLIPLFQLMAYLDWIDSYQALIAPWIAPAFGVFLMRQFITQTISDEMLDAGRIDGASEFGLFWRLVLPVVRPALAALGIWFFLNIYNAFLWPLVVLSSTEKFTLPLGLTTVLTALSAQEVEYGLAMAGSIVAAAPMIVVFVVLRRQFIEGLTLGSVKG
jgi:multiple sugar transport system permease protein